MLEVGIFVLKAFTIVICFGALIVLIAVIAARAKDKPELEVEPLHTKFEDIQFFLKSFTLEKDELKAEKKKRKAEAKEKQKNQKGNDSPHKRIFVLEFLGDVHASAVESLREEVTSLLAVATPEDEVVVILDSPGGVVHGYGLAASQLLRIRERGIPVTACVDQVAASGGYLMACVANQIVAAPFAIIGSIGVVAQVPNFHRVLKKYDVDYKEYTAGEFKRTVSLLGEITAKGESKFLEQLESTHLLFKTFVSQHRPQLDLAKVATGEYWYGTQAKELGLIDKIQTSDDYLLANMQKDTAIYKLSFKKKVTLSDKISDLVGKSAVKVATKSFDLLARKSLF
jgi:serine protease SohB